MMQSLLVSRQSREDKTESVAPQPSYLAEYVLFPFYDFIVQFYPRSWMPNTVTLFGVAMTLLSSLLLLSSMPLYTVFNPGHALFVPLSFVTDDVAQLQNAPLYPTRMQPYFLHFLSPAVLLVLCGILNLVYCVADNTDGRLARRDGKKSQTGEYLDHGLDCVTSLLSTCVVFCVNAVSMSNMATAVCLISFATVLSHTLNYERGIFIWGTRFATVDEAMIFFGVAMWLPVIFPAIASSHALPMGLMQRCFGANIGLRLSRLRWLELLYIGFNIAQAQTIFDLARRHARMLLRLHVWFVIVNAMVLLVGLKMQTPYVSSAAAAKAASCAASGMRSTCAFAPGMGIPCYTLGPFAYPAVWIITVAFSSSILVHVPIHAHCAHLARVRLWPLAGVVLVWALFLTCPAAAAVTAVAMHTVQVMYNLHYITHHTPCKAAATKE